MHHKGKITRWNDDKGFGFITPSDGGKEIFIHATGFYYRNKRPFVNQRVTYTISHDKNGRLCAIESAFHDAPKVKRTVREIKATTLVFPFFFLFFIGFMVLITELPIYILVYYIAVNILTFAMYGQDKNAARKKQQRTSENTLHLFSLLGGWPSALIAQQKFRHKTRKQAFLLTYWITVVVNCAGFIWLLTPQGLSLLDNLEQLPWR